VNLLGYNASKTRAATLFCDEGDIRTASEMANQKGAIEIREVE
jgi:hypothetical protein